MPVFSDILTKAYLTFTGQSLAQAGSQADARAAIGAASTAELNGAVTAAIAADDTVIDAAAAAVGDAIVGLDVVERSNPILPQPIENPDWVLMHTDTAGRVFQSVDTAGRTKLKLHPDTKVHSANIGDDLPVPLTTPTDGTVIFAITDALDQAALAVHPDGTVTIPKPSEATLEAFATRYREIPEPSWSTKNRAWNAEKALYNYHPTKLQRWYVALARAMSGVGTAHVACFMDSETYGAGSSNPKWQYSWPGRVRRQFDLQTGYASGTGIAVPWNAITETPTHDPRWTFGAAAVQIVSNGGDGTPLYGPSGKGAIRLTNSSGTGYLVFAPVGSVDRFTVWALADSGASGTATVKVDGTTVGTFDVSAAGGGGTLARRSGLPTNVIVVDIPLASIVSAIPAFTAGTHTIRVEGPAASTVVIWGMEGGTGKGVRISNMGRSSLGLVEMVLDDTTNHNYGMPLHFDSTQPDLAIFMLGLNDRTNDTETFQAGVTTAIARVRANNGDVLLVCPGNPNSNDLQARLADMYALSDALDVPLLDTAWVRTSFAVANAQGLYYDTIHSNDVGLEHHARLILNALTGV